MIRRKILPKNKKAVSAIVGYVLLITFGIVLSVIVYNYLKSYVPKDLIDCPEGVSIFVKDYNCANGQLNVTLKNNGRFDLAGYSIHTANNTEQKIATTNLAKNFINSSNMDARSIQDSYILFSLSNTNAMGSGNESEHYFNYSVTEVPKILEITPLRFEIYEEKVRFATCGNAKTREIINCA
ncbi:MAG: hypothetical protein PF542_02885 [Nanoarchaeota archaeon]|nr:hypothetical protein [Nanoarchaeota archaeon]